jgi:hypothetical protein
VVAGLQGLRGQIERTAGVAGVEFHSGLETMVGDPSGSALSPLNKNIRYRNKIL